MEKVTVLQVRLGDWHRIPFNSAWIGELPRHYDHWVQIDAHMDRSIQEMGIKQLKKDHRKILVIEDYGYDGPLPILLSQALFQWYRDKSLVHIYFSESLDSIRSLQLIPAALKTAFAQPEELSLWLTKPD